MRGRFVSKENESDWSWQSNWSTSIEYYTSIARCARTESLDIEPPSPLLPISLKGPVTLREHDGGESIVCLLQLRLLEYLK